MNDDRSAKLFASGPVALDEVLVTHELGTRPSRPPEHALENAALVSLAQGLAEDPESLLQRLTDAAMQLCRAGSAGISLEETSVGEDVFRWRATAGELAPYAQNLMPRRFSPCGTVLDTNAPQLMSDPVRFFPYISQLECDVCEVLLIPFYRLDQAIGTIWVVHHTHDQFFDAEDARLLSSLSRFASAAVQTLQVNQEARRAAATARQSEDRAVAVLESITDGFVALDREWRFTYVNSQAERLMGRPASDLLGKNLWEEYPAMLTSEFGRAYRLAGEGRVSAAVTEYYPGHSRWYEARAYPASDGITIYFHDVSERENAERALREIDRVKEHRLAHQKRLLDAVLAMRVNADLTIDVVLSVLSKNIREAIGAHQCVTSLITSDDWSQTINSVAASDEFAGALREYTTPPDGSGIYRLVVEQNRTFRLTQAELEAHPAWRGFSSESGKHPPLRGWLAAPMLDVEGRPIGLIQLSDKCDGEFTAEDEAELVQFAQVAAGLLENVRLYKQSQRENLYRREAEAALQQADRRKNEFLAMLAHELRGPLAPLRNGLQVMRLAADSPEVIASCRDMMDRQLAHMVRLIDDLLDVSRVSQNKMDLRRAKVSLADVIASAVETARPTIEASQHQFTITLPPRPLFLDADLTRLGQVFSNLLTNSAKYTPAGGRIALTAELEGDEVVVAVTDDGLGIPAASLPTIFDLFSQVDRNAERTTGGLGIGLALVKGLVEMHGGSVVAASPGENAGSTFSVRLPLLASDAEPTMVGPEARSSCGPRRRILIADDNRDAADTMSTTLRLLGHETAVAYDGLSALETSEQFHPEVILMDVGMPRLDGHEATRRIRAASWGRDAMIIALTGWGQDADRANSLAAGCDGHLVKPVGVADLQALLANLAEQRTPRAS